MSSLDSPCRPTEGGLPAHSPPVRRVEGGLFPPEHPYPTSVAPWVVRRLQVSLRKFPGSGSWYACFTLPDGKRVQRSTKDTLRKPAQAKADQWESLSKERAKARQSHRVIAEIYGSAHKEELPNASISAFVDCWLRRREREIAPSSYTAYANAAGNFVAWLGDSAARPLADLDTKHFIAFRDAQAKRVSAVTVNKFIKPLRVIFEDARREGYLADIRPRTASASRRQLRVRVGRLLPTNCERCFPSPIRSGVR